MICPRTIVDVLEMGIVGAYGGLGRVGRSKMTVRMVNIRQSINQIPVATRFRRQNSRVETVDPQQQSHSA